MENEQLHSIKLDISKYSQLLPYERIAFHKILGLSKTDNGKMILLQDLKMDSIVRESAISTLADFNSPEVTKALLALLHEEIEDREKIIILGHLELFGTYEDVPDIIRYIEKERENPDSFVIVSHAFDVLRLIGSNSDKTEDYLKKIALDTEIDVNIRALAIVSLTFSKDIVSPSSSDEKSLLELVIREEFEELTFAAYKAIIFLNEKHLEGYDENLEDSDQLFTYSQELEDRSVLDMRVLLGRMTPYFDSYSNKVKIVYLGAMISCNHREFLMYTMKALTSGDPELMDMTLDLLLSKVYMLRDPDKLFRSLIALSVDSPRGNDIIVDIFERYFRSNNKNRRYQLLKDKVYNYIVVTIEAYFETYRKDFMITEVIEKNYPENFQNIRHYILEIFNPVSKKIITNYLKQNNTSTLHEMLKNLSEIVPYVKDSDKKSLNSLLEVLHDKDEKSREISLSRIDDINFEKRYLKDRIIRLCRIIGMLKIDNAASSLVIIYNYLKKYTDKDIFDAVSSSLSMLNYSYMLSELEVMLNTGDETDKNKAIKYLSLFTDPRSLNILLDYLKDKPEEDSEFTNKILHIILKQDISGNVTANQIFKKIIDTSENPEMIKLAILCVGRCNREDDIDYLNDLFFSGKEHLPKEYIVQSIGYIINLSMYLNKNKVIKHLKEYLKDPSIMVRIYSCFLLIQLGDKNALKSIRDMMTIKNKTIQREILLILGNLRSVEFAYFLISLLKIEYAISTDIIPIINLLKKEDISEVDHFIVNIFKKHEYLDFEDNTSAQIDERKKSIKDILDMKATLLKIDIFNFQEGIENKSIIDYVMQIKEVSDIIIPDITENKGIITGITNGKILSYFHDAQFASNTALSIYNKINTYNISRMPEDRIFVSIHLITDRFRIINEEIISFPSMKIEIMQSLPIINRVIIDEETMLLLGNNFYYEPFPDLITKHSGFEIKLYELISPVNFLAISEIEMARLSKEEEERKADELKIEAELKKQKLERRSTASTTYAQALDEIGRLLKNDLENINKYIQKRTTDRELINTVDKMLSSAYKRYFIEKSKMMADIE